MSVSSIPCRAAAGAESSPVTGDSGVVSYSVAAVPIDVAALGGEVQVATLEGHAKLKIPSGTEPGRVFRLRNKGLPKIDGPGKGDLHVQIVVAVPSRMSGKQKTLLKDFRDASTDSNYPTAAGLRKAAEKLYDQKTQLEEDQKK